MKQKVTFYFFLMLGLITNTSLTAQNWEQDTIISTDINKVLLDDSTIFSNAWVLSPAPLYLLSIKPAASAS